jgi:hypothetical protein
VISRLHLNLFVKITGNTIVIKMMEEDDMFVTTQLSGVDLNLNLGFELEKVKKDKRPIWSDDEVTTYHILHS